MNAQEQQVIESLFARILEGAAQAGPRDAGAEALIQEKLRTYPTAPYYMAQTLVLQERALQRAEQRIGALEQQSGGGSFASPTSGFQPGAASAPRGPGGGGGGGGGGFLAGAAQMALGIGGGILVAEAATSLAHGIFGGGFGGFGGFDGDEAAFERGYEAGQQDDQQDWGNMGGGGFDDGGDWGGGDFGGGDVSW